MTVRSRTGVLGRGTPRVPPQVAINSIVWTVATANETVTLPADPAVDDIIVIKADATVDASNPITVDGNGNTIDGQATREIAAAYAAMWVRYSGTEWQIV